MASPHSIGQNLNCFPHENNKQIDYVIMYKEFTEDELKKKKNLRIKRIRDLFFDKLEKETFEIYEINFKNENDENCVYVLMHCSTERLLEEAEQLNFELKLRNCHVDDVDNVYAENEKDKLSLAQRFKLKSNQLKEKYDKENYLSEMKNGNICSTVYDPYIKYMYEGIDDEKNYPLGPFSNNIRMILVDSIMQNVTFLNDQEVLKFRTEEKIKKLIMKNKGEDLDLDKINFNQPIKIKQTLKPKETDANDDNKGIYSQKNRRGSDMPSPIVAEPVEIAPLPNQKDRKVMNSKKGLIYMIEEKYFDDAFILHDESEKEVNFINELIGYINQKNKEKIDKDAGDDKELTLIDVDSDSRHLLKERWASLKKTLFFQPLWEIRDYLGEKNAFYFSWLGIFISTLWILAILGLALSCYGLKIGIDTSSNIDTDNINAKIDHYTNMFLYSFDNEYMPYFCACLCLWGFIFTEYWSRKEASLAFQWDTDNFNKNETDLPEFFRKKHARKDAWACTKKIYLHEKSIKKFFSFMVLLSMCGLVALSIIGVVLYRVWIKTKIFPSDNAAHLFLGDFGSIIINSLVTGLLNQLYKRIAEITTKWENLRTKTEYHNNLIFKLFIFNFVNNYGNLFYLAYFRTREFEHGYFGLGPEYVDKCTNDHCTPLLTTQLLILILTKSLPNLGFNLILPWFGYKKCLKKIRTKYENLYEQKKISEKKDNDSETEENKESNSEEKKDEKYENSDEYKKQGSQEQVDESQKITPKNQNEKLVEIFLTIEKEKNICENLIDEEYIEKTALYGYMIIFGAVFALAPFLLLVIFLINIRLISNGFIMYHRRSIGHKAQNIGAWINICRFLNVVAIVNLSCYTALVSTWSNDPNSLIGGNDVNRYIYIVVFENGAFLVWLFVAYLIPPVSEKNKLKMRQESEYIKKITTIAKQIESDSYHNDRFNINNEAEELIVDSEEEQETDTEEEIINNIDLKKENTKSSLAPISGNKVQPYDEENPQINDRKLSAAASF